MGAPTWELVGSASLVGFRGIPREPTLGTYEYKKTVVCTNGGIDKVCFGQGRARVGTRVGAGGNKRAFMGTHGNSREYSWRLAGGEGGGTR